MGAGPYGWLRSKLRWVWYESFGDVGGALCECAWLELWPLVCVSLLCLRCFVWESSEDEHSSSDGGSVAPSSFAVAE